MAALLELLLPGLRRLLPPGTRVLVAVSGGPDSQALLDLLARAAVPLRLGHLSACGIDHGLRPAAAAELQLAAQLARRHGLPFCRRAVALAPGGNQMAAARQARYAALRQEAATCGATALCLGHHADDQAETLLQRLCRGTTVAGLGCMAPRRGLLVRPLLGVRRTALLDYAEARALPFARDPSNDDLRRSRARLRHRVLPELARVGSRIVEQAGALAAGARADERFLQHCAAKLARRARQAGPAPALALAWAPLWAAPAPLRRRALQAFVKDALGEAAPRQFLAQLLRAGRQAGRHGRTTCHPRGPMRFWVSAAALWRQPTPASVQIDDQPASPWPPPGEGLPLGPETTARWRGMGLRLRIWRPPWDGARAQQFALEGSESVAFDAERLHFGLKLRPWRAGDRLQPYGLSGHVSVSDLLTNLKIPRALRAGWPLVTHGSEILWVVGLRRGAAAPIAAQTQQILCMQATRQYKECVNELVA